MWAFTTTLVYSVLLQCQVVAETCTCTLLLLIQAFHVLEAHPDLKVTGGINLLSVIVIVMDNIIDSQL